MPTIKTKRRLKAAPIKTSALDHRAILARRLDLIAGIELQHGHHRMAEHLAHRAAQLREARGERGHCCRHHGAAGWWKSTRTATGAP